MASQDLCRSLGSTCLLVAVSNCVSARLGLQRVTNEEVVGFFADVVGGECFGQRRIGITELGERSAVEFAQPVDVKVDDVQLFVGKAGLGWCVDRRGVVDEGERLGGVAATTGGCKRYGGHANGSATAK